MPLNSELSVVQADMTSGHIGLLNQDYFYIKIEFNSRRNGLVHQHGRRFFVLKTLHTAINGIKKQKRQAKRVRIKYSTTHFFRLHK